ncbi:MAG: electron transfer flavoprotein beta subunit/FixA family protein [Peptococcaceae bacterium]|jgi:electron transfer flavoprotein beta subunit|nr:MAG: electron transfer flavoprotein beta subunit/FixA family protein [Peptococcaceae bacterium]
MNIIVLIKQVPGTANVRMNPDTGTMIREAAGAEMNPLDVHAVTEAVRLKDMYPGTIVTALTMGPGSADKVLQEAVARGVDKGILLSHRAFAGSDTIATARVLSAAVRKLGMADLILAGDKTTDGETGQTGPMTAAMLDIPVVAFARKLEIVNGSAHVERMVETGIEKLKVSLPALITVVRDINKPALPPLRKVLAAKKISFPVWGSDELGIKEEEIGLKGSPTRVVKVFSPKFARQTVFYQADDVDKALDAVLDVLKTRQLL